MHTKKTLFILLLILIVVLVSTDLIIFKSMPSVPTKNDNKEESSDSSRLPSVASSSIAGSSEGIPQYPLTPDLQQAVSRTVDIFISNKLFDFTWKNLFNYFTSFE